MSTLSQFAGARIKSVQSIYVANGTAFSTGTGEDAKYIDVTISAVNTSKSIFLPSGYASNHYGNSMTPRLTSSTNVRLTNGTSATAALCRWQVVEFY